MWKFLSNIFGRSSNKNKLDRDEIDQLKQVTRREKKNTTGGTDKNKSRRWKNNDGPVAG